MILQRIHKTQRLPALNIIELLTAMGMLAVIFASGFQVFFLAIDTEAIAKDYITAELLARDLIELTISKRNEDWNSLDAGQYYFIEDPTEGFLFTSGTETIDKFTKSVSISTVDRDGSGNIVTTGGTLDEDVFKAHAQVTWTHRNKNYVVNLVQYLTNWYKF